MKTLRIQDEYNDDWIKALPGHADEVALHEQLSKKYKKGLRLIVTKGGPGSGHKGHKGRPGIRGGSVSGTDAVQDAPYEARRYTQTELDGLGFTFTEDRVRQHITISVPDLRTRTSTQIRLQVMNKNEVSVARPSKGSFNMGNDYGMTFPLKASTNTIARLMRQSRGGWVGSYHKAMDSYGDMVASAFDIARLKLKRMRG